VLVANSSETTADLTRRLIRAVQRPYLIWMLRIVAHGRPGYMQLGRGVRPGDADGFSPLQTYFSVTGRGVEIHSCNLAGGVEGQRLMQRLADAFGQPVAASPQFQLADNGFRFEGSVTRVTPRGRSSRGG
jgi:hypothetical protein